MTNEALLASWNETPTRAAIVGFVAAVTDEASPDFVAPDDRIAVFDNDGTLWTEKPLPIQVDFLLRRIGEMVKEHPELLEKQPYKAVAARDYAWLGSVIDKHYAGDDSELTEMAGGLIAAYQGKSIEEFEQIAAAFMQSGQHPTLGRPYLTCAFQPMVELLQYLSANGFANYIASGGGRDFMRTISEQLYAVPLDRVIGTSVLLEFIDDEQGPRIVHAAGIDVFDDGPAKPVRIWSRIGRRPILAGGNSNGDIPMLRFAGGPSRPALRLLVLHDDADREFDYVKGAEQALDMANEQDWTVISMKNDWKEVFPT